MRQNSTGALVVKKKNLIIFMRASCEDARKSNYKLWHDKQKPGLNENVLDFSFNNGKNVDF